MRKRIGVACGVLGVVLMGVVSWGLVMTEERGKWPGDWPKGMEGLRGQSRTVEVANGTQEDIYEIRFKDRGDFEKAWPMILSVKTEGAPLRLYKVGALPAWGLGQMESNAVPTVRIYGPVATGETVGPGGQMLKSGDWPKELVGAKGELPEYVVAELHEGKLRWVAMGEKNKEKGFRNRARVDIDLVVDGEVIDLNRIGLGSGVVEDHRF